MILRWDGERGSKETGPDIPARNEPPGRLPPSPFTIGFTFMVGRWELNQMIDEPHEALVTTAWRELHHGKSSS